MTLAWISPPPSRQLSPLAPTTIVSGCSGQDANSGDKNGAKKGIFHGCLLRFSAGLVKNSPRSRQGKKASELPKSWALVLLWPLFGFYIDDHSIIVSI